MLERMKKLEPYGEELEEQMRNLYQSLSEKDRRRYAAIEAKKLGYGGISYVCRVFGCDEKSVNRGASELETLGWLEGKRIREAGGGRKKIIDTTPGIDEAFLGIMSPHTAGSPMDETIKWSNLGHEKIAELLAEKGYKVSVIVVEQLLDKHDFRRRKAFKNEAGNEVENRDEQFKNIENWVEDARQNGNPVMSMDVKKKS
jgi:Rhodopirellula transposase DDE domain